MNWEFKMSEAVTKLEIAELDRKEAKEGANFLERAARRENQAGLFLVGSNGEKLNFELSIPILNALRTVLERMAEYEEVVLLDMEAELSPEGAAKILGISRPIVYQRMNSGRLPYREVGTHRRVLMKDVLKLKQFEDRRRKFSEALAADTEDLEINHAQSPQSST
jgi:excisionase family DNA binding protein